MGKNYGYARVSSKDQNEARQIHALAEFGVEKRNIFLDKQSGTDFNRKQYKKMLRKLQKDDVMIIKSIDRLGRDYDEILEQWRYITKTLGADIVVLDMPLLDTRSKNGDLTGKFISDIVLQILSYVAQIERENTRQRQKEGIQLAKERGVTFGRPRKSIPDQFEEVKNMFCEGVLTSRQAAELLRVSQTTFLRWYKKGKF